MSEPVKCGDCRADDVRACVNCNRRTCCEDEPDERVCGCKPLCAVCRAGLAACALCDREGCRLCMYNDCDLCGEQGDGDTTLICDMCRHACGVCDSVACHRHTLRCDVEALMDKKPPRRYRRVCTRCVDESLVLMKRARMSVVAGEK